MMVKVCGITRREDAEVAVKAGATAIGFVFYPKSPRYVAPERAAEIGSGLNIWKVGIFVDETAARVEGVGRAARLDVAQLYDGGTPEALRVWRAYRMPIENDAIDEQGCEAILVDGPANGISLDWASLPTVSAKLIVAGGLDGSNVAEAIRIARPWGVDASSKLETAPGIKDHEKVKAFVTAALAAGKEYA
jgi:phosphoribosylanthranilate isomerase